jgi:hypothetical protein
LLACCKVIQKEEAKVKKALQDNTACAAEAISVEKANITLLEQQEAVILLLDSLAMSLFM